MSDEGCVSYPGSPEVLSTPAKITSVIDYGWDAGANSVAAISSFPHLEFNMSNPVVGCVVGLKSSRAGVGIPERIQYGFTFQKKAPTGDSYAVIENGVVGSLFTRATALDETFEIFRAINGIVTYKVNGVIVHTSARRSFETMITSTCLFASGDSVG